MRIKSVIWFSLTFFLLLFLACSKPPKRADTVTIPLKYRAEILDPLYAVDESTAFVVNFLQRRLYSYSPEGLLEEDIAESETLFGRRVEVKIRKGGATTDDVVYALKRVERDANQAWVLEQIQSVRKISERLVEFTLRPSTRPSATDWLLAKIKLSLPQCAIFNAKVHQKTGAFEPFSHYRIAEQTGDRIFLKSTTNFPAIEFLAMPDETARYFAFREARLDVYEALGIHRKLPYDEELYEMQPMYDLVVLYAAINAPKKSALSNPAFRRAINHAFNRKDLCEKTLLGACSAADYPVPTVLNPPPREKFPESGEVILPKETETILFFTLNDKERILIAQYMRSIFARFNIRLEFRIVDIPSMVRENNKGTHGIYLMKWSADYPHAENFLVPLFHSRNAGIGGNRAHIKDAHLDNLLDNASYTVENTQRIEQRIRYLSPWIFIGFQNMQFYRLKSSRITIPKIFAGWSERVFKSP
ncbi:MAG: hypothetical protein LDLANPLL_02697 [Turneriella sp.]|nr:hypothetical protein [Turneriella sp.]